MRNRSPLIVLSDNREEEEEPEEAEEPEKAGSQTDRFPLREPPHVKGKVSVFCVQHHKTP